MIPLGIFNQNRSSNLALLSVGGNVDSNIPPSIGALSNMLLGNREVLESSGNFAFWDLSAATEDLVINVTLFEKSSIDKIICCWGTNDIGTLVGSLVNDSTGLYFPYGGKLLNLQSWDLVYTPISFSGVSSRLQEFVFTRRTASSIEITISKDIEFGQLYLCGIEVWGSKL